MRNRQLIAKAARMASLVSVPPSARTTRALLRNEYQKARQTRALRKGYPEYDDDQARDESGRWSGGGGGGGSASGTKPKEPKTQRDWSKVTAFALDAALIAATFAVTGPAGGGVMASAVGAKAIAGLARTSIGRTAMNAAAGMTATRIWASTVEPMLKHVGKLYGAAGLATAFEAFKSMGGKVPSGMTWRRLAAKFGIATARRKLVAGGPQIARAVRQAVAAARRALRGALRTAAARG